MQISKTGCPDDDIFETLIISYSKQTLHPYIKFSLIINIC